MATNIEIKAVVREWEGLVERAETICGAPAEILNQEDTFFMAPRGRLKLREENGGPGKLVYYERGDESGPRKSDYIISESFQPESLKAVLEGALGIRGVLRKKRMLFMAGQTRIHIDDVENLGKFMELEVVLEPGQSEKEGMAIAEGLMKSLGIKEEDLLEKAYMDLLEARS